MHPWQLQSGYAGSQSDGRTHIVFLHEISEVSSELPPDARYMTSEEGFKKLESVSHGCVNRYIPIRSASRHLQMHFSNSGRFKQLNQKAFIKLATQVRRELLSNHFTAVNIRSSPVLSSGKNHRHRGMQGLILHHSL
jgi:hypothetical protein